MCRFCKWPYSCWVSTPLITTELLLLQQISVEVCCNNYEGPLCRLNFSTLCSRRRHLHTVYLANKFKNKTPSIFNFFDALTRNRTCRNCSRFMANQNFKVSSPAVFLLPAIFARTVTIKKSYFAYGHLLTLLIITLSFNVSLSYCVGSTLYIPTAFILVCDISWSLTP
jgi:hypothetical protein